MAAQADRIRHISAHAPWRQFSAVIATNETVDVLRHGWQDAASTLAADVPEVAELLQARLEMAVATERLDERHLLDTIQEVESVTSRAGSPSGQALARRLRRTVYEYLLALDAARPLETAKAPVDQPATAEGGPMVGAEEVAALGHASRSRTGGATDVEETGGQETEGEGHTFEHRHELERGSAIGSTPDAADEAVVDPEETPGADAPASRRRFALRRRQRRGAEAPAGDAVREPSMVGPATSATDPLETDAAEPNWQFTPAGEPAVFDSGLDIDRAGDDDTAAGDVHAPVEAAISEPPVEPERQDEVEAETTRAESTDEAGDATPTFVAPRAGFHIVEGVPAHRADQEEEARIEMPAFTADEQTAGEAQGIGVEAAASDPQVASTDNQPEVAPAEAVAAEATATDAGVAAAVAAEPANDAEPAGAREPAAAELAPVAAGTAIEPGDAGSDFLAWRPPVAAPAAAEQVTASPERAATSANQPVQTDSMTLQPAPLHVAAAAQPTVAPAETAPVQPPDDEDDGESRGWGVRRHGEARTSHRGAHAVAVPPVEDDPFENNTRLSDMRRRIEERLRRKRCDEAAALLQQIAQETGGRAVAELAMNVGDRCRALGKSNAALNCYLAAARSDPVYELPLSRLADICIDNQDTELAVSYLERIARIYRFRGEDRAALRTYRRIATIAPYREDVLTLLMNAQRTGQLE
jgi:hypothetical protein